MERTGTGGTIPAQHTPRIIPIIADQTNERLANLLAVADSQLQNIGAETEPLPGAFERVSIYQETCRRILQACAQVLSGQAGPEVLPALDFS